jgi:tetratricopeptide (TPR) repeat protein
MAQREGPANLSFLVKNLGFIMRNILVAGRKAEEYFKKSGEVARQIGAIGILGEASLGLGLLYKSKGKTDEAKEHFSEAIEAFEKCGAEGKLKQTREALATCEV